MSLFLLINPDLDDIPIDDTVLLGRGSECDVRLKDPEASRKHATFYVEGDNLYVRDEGSANGTFVNEARIEAPTELSFGDLVRIGNTTFTIEVTDEQDVTPTVFAEEVDVGETLGAISTVEEVESVEAPPAAAGPAAPPADEKKRSPLLFVGIGCGVLAVIALCTIAAVFALNQFGVFDGLFGGLDLFSGSIPEYSLEEVLAEETLDDRPSVIGYLGRPDAFKISEIMVEGSPVRVETWQYFAFGTRVDFVDGEATWTMEIEPVPEDSILPAWYDPLAFELGMSPAEAARVASAASPAGMPPEAVDLSAAGEDLSAGSMLVGDQIILGLDETGLIYVETIGLFPEGEGGS